MAGRTIGQLKKDKRSKQKKQADFLAWFKEYASVSRACKKSKVPRSNIYEWQNTDETFKQLFDNACEIAAAALEDEAVRRAYEGTVKPIFQGGKKVGNIREYSDTLLIVLLKARMPDKYKERTSNEHSGLGGKPLQVSSSLEGLTFEQLYALKYGYGKKPKE